MQNRRPRKFLPLLQMWLLLLDGPGKQPLLCGGCNASWLSCVLWGMLTASLAGALWWIFWEIFSLIISLAICSISLSREKMSRYCHVVTQSTKAVCTQCRSITSKYYLHYLMLYSDRSTLASLFLVIHTKGSVRFSALLLGIGKFGSGHFCNCTGLVNQVIYQNN